jgi:AcrR family transcriptional regulator
MPIRNENTLNPVWNKKRPPSRGPRPSVNTERIARVAIEVADADGLEAVTMQRIAREIGLTTMALYRYVSGKSELIDLMIDSASDSAAPIFGKPSSPWSDRLKEWARRCLAIYREHPWFLEATSTRRSIMGPNELAWMESAVAMLAESGLAPEDRHSAFLALIAHVRGHATFQQIRKYSESPRKWTRDLVQLLGSQPDRYPVLLQAVRSGAFEKAPGQAFDFGLDCILEGIRTRVKKYKTKPRSGSKQAQAN